MNIVKDYSKKNNIRKGRIILTIKRIKDIILSSNSNIFAFTIGILMIQLSLIRGFLWENIIFAMFDVLLEIIVLLLFIISLILSIVNWFNKKIISKIERRASLIINLFALIIALIISAKLLYLDNRFEYKEGRMNEVVKLVKEGKIKGIEISGHEEIELPRKYRNLSKGGGEISVFRQGDELEILFYINRGMMSSSIGYLYVENDSQTIEKTNFLSECSESSREKLHWYNILIE